MQTLLLLAADPLLLNMGIYFQTHDSALRVIVEQIVLNIIVGFSLVDIDDDSLPVDLLALSFCSA